MPNTLSIRSYSTKPASHSHHFNQLVLPLKGVIHISVANFNGKVAPGECVVVKAGEEHLFTANCEARFVVADLDVLPNNLLYSEQVVFAINTSLVSYLVFIEKQLEHKINVALENSMFDTFFLLLKEQSLLPVIDNRIGNAIAYIERNIAEKLAINHLAKVAFLSDTQFKKLFKKHTGHTVMGYVTMLRMEKAQALLRHTDYSFQLIGEKVGYHDLSTFSRKFSLYCGLSPTQFKK